MPSLIPYIGQRLLWAGMVVVGITLLTFVVTNIIPADPAHAAAGLGAREAQVEEMRRRMGLDRPLHEQYLRYIGGLARGDWGVAARTQRPVQEEILTYLPATLELVIVSMIIALAVGLPLGVIAAMRPHSFVDRLAQSSAVAASAMPAFWLALLMQIVFFLQLGWFPAGGRFDRQVDAPESITGLYVLDSILLLDWSAFTAASSHLVLPAVTLSFSLLGNLVRITRRAVLTSLRRDYVRTARAKGLNERQIIGRHVLKNAAIPIITIIGLQTGWLFSSAVLVEVVFSWPGIGKYAVDAIAFLDFKALMGVVLVIALIFVFINLLVDIAYLLVDPRVRY